MSKVGVAGLCIDRKNDAVLVIREKDALITGYKLPGGLADPHEDIGAAAVREVYEETGVAARFRSIVGFREQHNVGFGVSDLYFVCRCEPVSTDITHCPREIAEAKWMPVDEYIHSTSQMNAAIARMVVGALRYECEQDEDMHSDPPSYNSGVALSCDVSTSQMDSVYVKDRIVNLHLPAAAMKYVNVDDPWGGQDHLPIHLIKK